MIILLLGVSGAGKDTQAALLKDKGFDVIGTGDLLRKRAAQGDTFGKDLEDKMMHGFVDTQIVYDLLAQTVNQDLLSGKDVLLNAAVRKHEQIAEMDKLLAKFQVKLDRVIMLDLSAEEAAKRLVKRGQETKNRRDDNPATIDLRIKHFKKDEQQILAEYRRRGILHTVNADGTVEQVHQAILEVINKN